MWTADGVLVSQLTGHTGPVGSVSFSSSGDILTGGWDGTVRRYHNNEFVNIIDDKHKYSSIVLGLQSGTIVTASANYEIHIFDAAGTLQRSIKDAHDNVVRNLSAHPLGFTSCGNDGAVKVWTEQGDLLHKFDAHMHNSKFVHGLATLPCGGIVTSGEDSAVKIWSADGKLQQSIGHPGSVRSVRVFPNGDLLTCCADGTARIFSKDASRLASKQLLDQFKEVTQLAMISNMEQIDPGTLPGIEALSIPGTKQGQVLVLRDDEKGLCTYQWDMGASTWTYVGAAMGMRRKDAIDGKEYDVVTEVMVSDDRSLKLGFDRDEDAGTIADRFLTQHGLPPYFRDQIMKHVSPHLDPLLHAQRIKREEAKRRRVQYNHFPVQEAEMVTFSDIDFDKVMPLLTKSNEAISAADNSSALSTDEQESLELLRYTLEDFSSYHSAKISAEEFNAMRKMCGWPADQCAPALHFFRALLRHPAAADHFVHELDEKNSDETRVDAFLCRVATETSNTTYSVLALRALMNMFSRRKLAWAVASHCESISDALESLIDHSSKHVRQALMTLCINFAAIFLTNPSHYAGSSISLLGTVVQCLQNEVSLDSPVVGVMYRALVVLGSLVSNPTLSRETVDVAVELEIDSLLSNIGTKMAHKSRIVACAKEVQEAVRVSLQFNKAT
jgi:phospholipase A-2-activating protein